jgi:hypothetical protein
MLWRVTIDVGVYVVFLSLLQGIMKEYTLRAVVHAVVAA